MLKPLQQFICDTCGRVIGSPDDGRLEWLSYYDEHKRIHGDYRICHHKCRKHERNVHSRDGYLSWFVGDSGMAELLNFLDLGPYHSPTHEGTSPKSMREFVELMRRLTIPYYEEARQWWTEASHDEYFDGINDIAIYLPENLKAMVEHYHDREEDSDDDFEDNDNDDFEDDSDKNFER